MDKENTLNKATGLKKVYYGLWIAYIALSSYGFWYFREISGNHFFDDSHALGLFMAITLLLIVVARGRLDGERKMRFSPIVLKLTLLHAIVTGLFVFLGCFGRGFCGMGAMYIGAINGLGLFVIIVLVFGVINGFSKFRKK